MKNVRRGIGVLALAFAIGTVGACAGNNRYEPDRRPRASRGSSAAPAKAKTRVKRDDRRGGRDENRGQRRGQKKNKGDDGNRSNGKGRGNP